MHKSCKKCQKQYSEAQLKYFKDQKLPVPEYCRDCRKSLAKASGLKSAFDVGDGTSLITSFGKGNDAICEKRITPENNVKSINTPEMFSLTKSDGSQKKYAVDSSKRGLLFKEKPEIDKPEKGRSMSSVRLNGYHNQVERRFFGQETFSDNIHIQIAYNIMDIEKIMAVHINNILFSINNLFRVEGNEADDFLGYQGLTKTYEDYIADSEKSAAFRKLVEKNDNNELKNTRFGYFGSAFASQVQPKTTYRIDEDIYYILCMLGQARQMLAHGKDDKSKAFLYNIGSFLSANKNDIQDKVNNILDEIYNSKIQSLSKNFIKYSKKDIYILLKVLDCGTDDEKRKVIKDYYDFVVLKKNKNLGFSITKLREIILETFNIDGKSIPLNEDYDPVRSKLYKAFDFLIYRYYTVDNEETAAKLVNSLRSSLSEEEKSEIYRVEAEGLLKKIETSMNGVCELIGTGSKVANINDVDIIRILPQEFLEKNFNGKTKIVTPKSFGISKKAEYFSKFIYLMTLFIDGKEINDLLTTLINKFENIASLINVLNELSLDISLNDNYKMFARSGKISSELRVINSFARMESPAPNAKETMFIDAIHILGLSKDENNAKEFYKKNICPYCFDENGNIIDNKAKTKHIKNSNVGIYNFIANNVVESDRFRYLVRYANPKKIRILAENKQVVSFAVNKLPASQIVRHYNACNPGNRISEKTICDSHIEYLIKLVTEMSFDKIKGVENNTYDEDKNKAKRKAKDKEKKQAIISFYLTILYHIVKNLVYVNSRYFMAFHCLERDMNMFGEGTRKQLRNCAADYSSDVDDCVLTRNHIQQENEKSKCCDGDSNSQIKAKSKRRRWCYLLQEDIDALAGAEVLRTKYRNAVAHLNIPRNANDYIDGIGNVTSYFALYHYMMQQYLLRYSSEDEKKCLERFRRNGEYSMDLVKALNAPFGYNLPRFKNLSIEGLFDMNKDIPEKDETESAD